MPIIVYVKCFFIGIFGMAISVLLIMNNMKKKAKLANLEFSEKQFFMDDKYILTGNFIWIILVMMLIPFIIGFKPEWEKFLEPAFVFIGYIGCDILSRLASVANSKLNSAINYKSDISDAQTGTLGTPTPTEPPKETKP